MDDIKVFNDVKPGDVIYLAVSGDTPQVKEVTVPYVFTLKEYYKHIFGSDAAAEDAYKKYISKPYNMGDDVMFFWFPDFITTSDEGHMVWDGFIRVNRFMPIERGISDFTDRDNCLSCSVCTTRELAVDELRSKCGDELRAMYRRMKSLNDRYEQLRKVLLYSDDYQLLEVECNPVQFKDVPDQSPLYVLYKTYHPFEVRIRKIPWIVRLPRDTKELNIPEDNHNLFFKTIPYEGSEVKYFIVEPTDTSFKFGNLLDEKLGVASEPQAFTTFAEAKKTALKYWKFQVNDKCDDTAQARELLILLDLEALDEEDINEL